MALDPNNLSPARKAKTYTTFTSDLDLIADSGTDKVACRRIRVVSGGVVGVYFKDDPGTLVLITYAAGDTDDVQLSKIARAADGTTATAVTVYW